MVDRKKRSRPGKKTAVKSAARPARRAKPSATARPARPAASARPGVEGIVYSDVRREAVVRRLLR